MAEPLLKITNLHAEIAEDGTEILKGLELELPEGEIHAIMGPNGSGKSTLSKVISGPPAYEVTDGEILFRGQSVLDMEPDERARAGIFLAFQYPVEIPGVSVANFMRTALGARRGEEVDVFDYQDELEARHGHAGVGPRLRAALGERRLQRRREEAQRDPAAGHARAVAGGDGRDRQRAGHRRAEDRDGGDQQDQGRAAGHLGAADHALPADAQLHHPRPGARDGGRAHHPLRWRGAGAGAGGARV